ncbi:ATP-binding cassette sub-family C member 5-like [Glandiceps talaboti]
MIDGDCIPAAEKHLVVHQRTDDSDTSVRVSNDDMEIQEIEDDKYISKLESKECTGIYHRPYSYAEALQCHDFDMSAQAIQKDYNLQMPMAARKTRYHAWKTLKPIRRKRRSKYLPMEDVGLWSFLWYTWLTPLLKKACKEGLTMDDMWLCPKRDSAEFNSARLQKLWKDEIWNQGEEKASLRAVFWRFSWKELTISIISQVIFAFACFSEVLIVHDLLQYIQGTESNLLYALVLTFLTLITQTIKSLSISCQWTFGFHVGMKLRSAVLATIYRKVLALRNLQDQTVGQIINLCTNDGQRIFDAAANTSYLIGGPLVVLICIIYSTYILGPTALLGSLLFVLAYPLQVLASKAVATLRVKSIEITDRRVRMINEMITSIKLIKMYAWERPFAEKVADIRNSEKKVLQRAGFVQGLSQSINPVVQVLSVILTFTVHVSLGYELTPAMAYAVVAMFAQTRFTLLSGPRALKAVAECFVAIHRIKKFLLMEELQAYTKKPTDQNVAIEMSMASFAWDKQEQNEMDIPNVEKLEERELMSHKEQDFEESTESAKFVKTLYDIDLNFKKGQLVGVCGSVGSGKSSLISAILAQMQLVSGQVAIDGSISYVSQQAWIFNATLKENIVFGCIFNAKLYETVVSAACLNEDITNLPNGDETEIGERGINLSGGQKQRLSLARALYASRDIYLLDDPLSAVDVKVGKHIFNHYIKGELQEKTVIFVTHQLQYLSGCDYIIVMSDGRIREHGTHHQLMSKGGQYTSVMDTFHCEVDEAKQSHADVSHMSSKSSDLNYQRHSFHGTSYQTEQNKVHCLAASSCNINYPCGVSKTIESKRLSRLSTCTTVSDETNDTELLSDTLMSAEEINVGVVSWKTYHCYIKQAGGYLLSLVMLLLLLLSIGSNVACVWWLGYWITEGTKIVTNGTNTTDAVANVNLLEHTEASYFVIAFIILLVAMVILIFLKCLMYVKVTQKAASTLHDKVFLQVFRGPMSFFDTTPSGRILNRFSRDQDEVDVLLPSSLETFLDQSINVLFLVISIIIVFPWFLLALIPFSFIYLLTGKYFRHAIRDMKRLENVSRSPWFSQITATVQGLPTIHAYNKKEEFFKVFTEQVDVNAVANFLFHFINRWNSVRLNLIATLTTFVTALFVVLTHGQISPSYSGVAMISAMQMSGMFQHVVRLMTELEARFTSVERLYYYIMNISSEAPGIINGHRPPDKWPNHGKVQMERLKICYRENLPLALKGVSFDVKPMEKIGIVGRTGAGKSSLCLSIFRLMEAASGTIWIDDIDISTIGLEDLRSRLSIIPQAPVLFVGTIRYNLDPFDNYDDDVIWDALEKCYLKDMVTQLDGRLAAPVVENGENLSVGERQLICMARALLRKSKILVLDEATASIDTNTDSLIQQTIRDAFKECTMLIIAHRLNTILTCDKILVMDSGKVAEFDKPSVLLANHNSTFSTLMAAAERSKECLK